MDHRSPCAIITAMILDNKEEIHGLLAKLKENELDAGTQTAADLGGDADGASQSGLWPWKAFNPYEIWWMVVLIASISFLGYFAVRSAGASRGLMFTSLFAGLSSSTAPIAPFCPTVQGQSRYQWPTGQWNPDSLWHDVPRLLLVCMLINPELGPHIDAVHPDHDGIDLFTGDLFLADVQGTGGVESGVKAKSWSWRQPWGFATILALIILMSHVPNEWLGTAGIFILAGSVRHYRRRCGHTDHVTSGRGFDQSEGCGYCHHAGCVGQQSCERDDGCFSIGGRPMLIRTLFPWPSPSQGPGG